MICFQLTTRTRLLSVAFLSGISLLLCPGFAQTQSDQAIFQDEKQMMQVDQQQEQKFEQEKADYEQQLQQTDPADTTYRLYAEKRIAELTKLKAAGGSPSRSLAAQKNGELYALERWLAADQQAKAAEQEHVKQLDQAIANLQQSENSTMNNLNSDVQSLREDSKRQVADDKFRQQMQINQFNELQSEMGAASWGRPPTDGTFNSVGGYGFGGGYGYSMYGGRRFGGAW